MLFPVGRHAHELARVGSRDPEVHGDLVSVREELLRLEAQVGEAGPVHREELHHACLRRLEARCRLVLDEVVGTGARRTRPVARVEQVVGAAHRVGVIHLSSFGAGRRSYVGGHRRKGLPRRPFRRSAGYCPLRTSSQVQCCAHGDPGRDRRDSAVLCRARGRAGATVARVGGHPAPCGRVRRERGRRASVVRGARRATSRSSRSSTESNGCSDTATQGDIFGEVPITLGMPFPAGYRAAEPSRIMRIEAHDYHAVAATVPDVAVKVGEIARGRIGGLQHIVAEPPPPRAFVVGAQLRQRVLGSAAVPRPQRDHVRLDRASGPRADGDPFRRRPDDRRRRRSARSRTVLASRRNPRTASATRL